MAASVVVPGAALVTMLSLPVLVVAQAARVSGEGWAVLGQPDECCDCGSDTLNGARPSLDFFDVYAWG